MSNELNTINTQLSVDYTQYFKQILNGVSEADFVQMMLPLIPKLPLEYVKFLLLNSTSDEINAIVQKISETDILNAIAMSTTDPVVGAEVACHDLLTLDSLKRLFTVFNTPFHLVSYSNQAVADTTFLCQLKDYVMEQRKLEQNKNLTMLYPYEDVILTNIAKHKAANDTLLDELVSFVEKYIKDCKKVGVKIKKEGSSKREYPEYDLALARVRDYFPILLEVASNGNTRQQRLQQLFNTYGSKSVYTVCRDVPGGVMQLLGYTNAKTVGYCVLTNPSIDKKFRDIHYAQMFNENKGVWESGGSGEEYIHRVSSVTNPEAITQLYKVWSDEEDAPDSAWNFKHSKLKDFVTAISANPCTPAEVLEGVVERICKYCEGHKNNMYYYEYLEDIVKHENLGERTFIRLAMCLVLMEKEVKSYMNACIPRVLIPLVSNSAITAEPAKILYELVISMGSRGLKALCALAGNRGAVGLDSEFSTSEFPAVRRNYAERSESLVELRQLCWDADREVHVIARRRYTELTGDKLLLGIFDQLLIEEH